MKKKGSSAAIKSQNMQSCNKKISSFIFGNVYLFEKCNVSTQHMTADPKQQETHLEAAVQTEGSSESGQTQFNIHQMWLQTHCRPQLYNHSWQSGCIFICIGMCVCVSRLCLWNLFASASKCVCMHTHARTHNLRKCVGVPPVPPPVLLDTTMLRWVRCNKAQMGSLVFTILSVSTSLSFTAPPLPLHPSRSRTVCLGAFAGLSPWLFTCIRFDTLVRCLRGTEQAGTTSQSHPRPRKVLVGWQSVWEESEWETKRKREKFRVCEREAQSCQRKRSSVHKHKGTRRMKRKRSTEGNVGCDERNQSWEEFESMLLKNEGRRRLHKSLAESRLCRPKEGLIMKLQRAAVKPVLQGATQPVNTHLVRAKVCRATSTHAEPSHFGVPPATR